MVKNASDLQIKGLVILLNNFSHTTVDVDAKELNRNNLRIFEQTDIKLDLSVASADIGANHPLCNRLIRSSKNIQYITLDKVPDKRLMDALEASKSKISEITFSYNSEFYFSPRDEGLTRFNQWQKNQNIIKYRALDINSSKLMLNLENTHVKTIFIREWANEMRWDQYDIGNKMGAILKNFPNITQIVCKVPSPNGLDTRKIFTKTDVGVYLADLGEWYEKNYDTKLCKYYYEQAAAWAYYIDKDFKRAIEYFKLAAGKNSAMALFMLGRCYWFGEGVERNLAEALDCFRRVSPTDSNYGGAQYYLGEAYRRGRGTNVDSIEADNCYANAITYWHNLPPTTKGYKNVQYNLAVLYREGLGTSVDKAKAKACLEKCDSPEAKQLLEKILQEEEKERALGDMNAQTAKASDAQPSSGKIE